MVSRRRAASLIQAMRQLASLTTTGFQKLCMTRTEGQRHVRSQLSICQAACRRGPHVCMLPPCYLLSSAVSFWASRKDRTAEFVASPRKPRPICQQPWARRGDHEVNKGDMEHVGVGRSESLLYP